MTGPTPRPLGEVMRETLPTYEAPESLRAWARAQAASEEQWQPRARARPRLSRFAYAAGLLAALALGWSGERIYRARTESSECAEVSRHCTCRHTRALAHGRSSHGCAVERSSHGQAMVCGKGAVRADRARAAIAGVSADRWSRGIRCRAHGSGARVRARAAQDQSLRLAFIRRRWRCAQGGVRRLLARALDRSWPHLLGGHGRGGIGARRVRASVPGVESIGFLTAPSRSLSDVLVPGFAAASRSASSFATTRSCSS